jgi:hypothetical protein
VEISKLQNIDKVIRMDQTNKIKYIEEKNTGGWKLVNFKI